MMDISTASGKILAGNLLFAACCCVYLIWWSVAFRPGYTAAMSIKVSLFIVTAILGVAGLVMIIQGCAAAHSPVRYLLIIGVGAAVYIIMLLLTNFLMHRQVTTELMLIVFWVCMEICACGALCGEGAFGSKAFALLIMIVVAASAAGMICYLKYYDLEPMTAFYDGMVPLILFALVMIGISVFQVSYYGGNG